MNNIDTLLNDIKNEIAKEECVKQYFYYKNIIDNDSELKSLDEEIKFHQKEMCRNQHNNEVANSEAEQYESLKIKMDSNPILINFKIAKEEVYSLLVDIKETLS